MRALEVFSYSGPSGAHFVDRPTPDPGYGEVLVRVDAAGLNYSDVAQMRGMYRGGPMPPYVAGIEACGEVVKAGRGVSCADGVRLLGCGKATFAEYVALPVRSLIPVPEHWSSTMGAGFFVHWMTAHASLRAIGRMREGETVLIHAGAGGVGSAAIQLAKYYGATVIATASTEAKQAYALECGADFVIDYRNESFVERVRELTHGRGVDLVLEMVGGETFEKNFEVVVPFGRIVVYGAVTGQEARVSNLDLIFAPVEVLGFHLTVLFDRRPDLFSATLEEMKSLTARGVVQPDEPNPVGFTSATDALADLERGRTQGKVVLVM